MPLLQSSHLELFAYMRMKSCVLFGKTALKNCEDAWFAMKTQKYYTKHKFFGKFPPHLDKIPVQVL